MAREGQKDEASELLSEDEEAFVQEQLQAGRMQFLLDLGLPWAHYISYEIKNPKPQTRLGW